MEFDNKFRHKSCGDLKSTSSMKSLQVGRALLRCMDQAECDGRLISGFVDIASELKGYTINNMLCVVKTSDNKDLPYVLLEAYCREFRVRLIKVNDIPEINHLNVSSGDYISRLSDSTSFLLKLPKQFSSEDEFVLTFYKTHQTYIDTFPTVKIRD